MSIRRVFTCTCCKAAKSASTTSREPYESDVKGDELCTTCYVDYLEAIVEYHERTGEQPEVVDRKGHAFYLTESQVDILYESVQDRLDSRGINTEQELEDLRELADYFNGYQMYLSLARKHDWAT